MSLWLPFQNAASSVTSLYKECIESQKRFSEFGFQIGQQRRNKELLAWAMKRKRHIRREDLIAFLSGRNTANSFGHLHHHYHHSHHRTWNSPKQRLSVSDSGISAASGRTAAHHSVALTRLSLSDTLTDSNSMTNISSDNNDETDLETFREALALSGIVIVILIFINHLFINEYVFNQHMFDCYCLNSRSEKFSTTRKQ